MKNLLIVASLMVTATLSQAATRVSSPGANSVTGILGFVQSAVNFGADYEHRVENNMGVGGYFLYSSEKKENAGKRQTISFGGNVPFHILEDSRIEFAVAPGFGITMVKGINSENDETVFGPSIQTDLMFRITPTVKAGIEHIYLTNWFNDKSLASTQYTNAAVNFSF